MLVGALAILAVMVVAIYLARRIIAREVLVGWLESRGVRADVNIERFEVDGVTASIRVGPPEAPELSVERVEVVYAARGFWSARPLGVDVSSVRLVRPVVRASLRDGVLSLGSLDPIVDEFRRRPPEPDATKPLILVEGGRARVETDYGLLALQADARIADAKLMSLDARLGPTELSGEGLKSQIAAGALSLRTTGDRIAISLRLRAPAVAADAGAAERVDLSLAGLAPYPDFEGKRGDGGVTATLAASAQTLRSGRSEAGEAALTARFEGRATGWADTLALAGPIRASLRAGEVRAPDAHASELDAGFAGQVRWSAKDWRVQGAASGGLRGGWSALDAPAAQDAAELAALKRAAADFALSAPAVAIAAGPQTLRVGLPAPIQARGRNGVRAVLSAKAGEPLYGDGSGAFRLYLTGGEAPEVDLAVGRYTLTEEGLDAAVAANADGSFGPMREAIVATSGTLAVQGGAVSFVQAGCHPARVSRIELGETDITGVEGRICAGEGPLFSLDQGRWRARARLDGLRAEAPFLETRIEEAAARLAADGAGQDLKLTTQVAQARLIDTASETRFQPVQAAGNASLAGERWTGRFDLSDSAGRALGVARLEHDMRAQRGGVVLDTGELVFAQGALQPGDLSPMASALGPPVDGRARFEGGMEWSGETLSSSGVLKVPSLAFRSAAGPVVGLSGTIRFTSLVPLETAPGQQLRVESVESLAPLTHIALDFQLVDELLKVQAGSLEVGGGRLELEPLTAPLSGAAFEGVVLVEGVQLSDLVARSPFADRVSLDAKVSGRLPFVLGPEGVRFIEGQLHAVQPGRLSIRREALSNVAAEGGEAAVADGPAATLPAPQETNTVTEFAFQALENLAFESLSAEVNSLPEGRLGVLFKIQGAHEPPQEQSLELGIGDLLRKDLLQRRLPLPSHTKVNLTLDTTLNLDQLLKDFAETQRAGSGAVQP